MENIIISTFVRLLRLDGQHRSAHAGGGGSKGRGDRQCFSVLLSLKFDETLRPFSIYVRFARAGEAFIVFDARHARVSRFSKPARAKRLQWKPAFREELHILRASIKLYTH